MADFIYDQMITAQDLNDIAVDLGAGDFSVFSDGVPYAVGKLNEITSALVGSGISSALNKFEITVSSAGVVVGTGIAFFETGKKFKLTVPLTIPFKAGELYFYENLSTGAVSVNIGGLPADNYIHIATINSDMTYIDKRKMAKAKVQLPTEADSYSFVDTVNIVSGVLDHNTVKIPITGVSKIYIKRDYRFTNNNMKASETSLAEFNVKNGTWIAGYCVGYINGPNTVQFRVDKTELVLKNNIGDTSTYLKVNCSERNNEYVVFKYICEKASTFSVNIEYTVFGGVVND